jgi:hypothetical protein
MEIVKTSPVLTAAIVPPVVNTNIRICWTSFQPEIYLRKKRGEGSAPLFFLAAAQFAPKAI